MHLFQHNLIIYYEDIQLTFDSISYCVYASGICNEQKRRQEIKSVFLYLFLIYVSVSIMPFIRTNMTS